MKKMFLVLSAMAILCAPSFADEKADKEQKNKQIRKLFDLLNSKETFEGMKDNMKRNAAQMLLQKLQQEGLEANPEAQKVFTDFMENSLQKSLDKLVDINKMLDDMVPYYEKYLSAEDVNELIKFYEAPAGKHLIEATPKIMKDYMPDMMKTMQDKMKAMEPEQKILYQDFSDSLQKIKDKEPKKEEPKKEPKKEEKTKEKKVPEAK